MHYICFIKIINEKLMLNIGSFDFQVTSLKKSDGFESVRRFYAIGNRFHVTLRILCPKILFKMFLDDAWYKFTHAML